MASGTVGSATQDLVKPSVDWAFAGFERGGVDGFTLDEDGAADSLPNCLYNLYLAARNGWN